MNNVGLAANAFANVVSPFSPAGRQVVGLENSNAKQDLLAPVEQAKQSDSALNDQNNTPANFTNSEEQASVELKQQADKKDEQRRQAVEDQQLVSRLSARDAEVRAHEAAHASVGGQFTGSPSYSFQRGPDGVDYAVGGEVRISIPSGGASPEATLQALQQVRAAALAPAEPSEQDRQVAAQAASQAVELRAQITAQALEQDQQLLAEAAAEREAKAEQKQRDQTQSTEARQQDEQRLVRQQTGRRNALLGDELVTLDNLQRSAPGTLFSQLA